MIGLDNRSISSSLYVEVGGAPTPPNSPRTPPVDDVFKKNNRGWSVISARRKIKHDEGLLEIRQQWLIARADRAAQMMDWEGRR